MTKNFNEMNNSLNKYGALESVYKDNLKNEMEVYQRIRRLDESDNEKITYNQQAGDLKLDKAFEELKNSSLFIIQFIQNFNEFTKFDEKINKYINDINYQNRISENTIKKNTENYDDLKIKLDELTNFCLNYYDEANLTYYKMKESIINYVMEINNIIEKCANITYKSISDKYIEYKNNFNKINNEVNDVKESVNIEKYKEQREKGDYTIETNIKNYKIDNKFTLDILFEGKDIKRPKIVEKVINRNKPKNFEIDIYINSGHEKLGRKINVEFNNISSSIEINYYSGLNDAIIKTNFSYDEYNIYTRYYQSILQNIPRTIGGISFNNMGIPGIKYIETPENEKYVEIIQSKTENKNISYSY